MSRELILRYREALDPYTPDLLAELRHPAWTAEWPQSGERIRGHEADRAIHENYPGYPRHELRRVAGRDAQWAVSPLMTLMIPVRVLGAGSLWVVEEMLEYPNGERYHGLDIVELRDGVVFRETAYFLVPFDAPNWRGRWVERMAAPSEAVATSTMGGPVDEQYAREAIAAFLEALGSAHIVEALRALFHDDVVEEWPQSWERVRSIENVVAVMESYPGPPTATVRRIVGEGDLFTFEAELDYSGSPWFQVGVLEFRNGKVARSTEYFGEPFDAPEWRSKWVEKIERGWRRDAETVHRPAG